MIGIRIASAHPSSRNIEFIIIISFLLLILISLHIMDLIVSFIIKGTERNETRKESREI